MSPAIKTVTDAGFATDVLASKVPVLVDYWAQWCGPCKMIAPMLNELAEHYAGQLTIAKIEVDENPQTPHQYHIRSIPTLMLFKEGRPVATTVGAVSKSQLAAFIEDNLRESPPLAAG